MNWKGRRRAVGTLGSEHCFALRKNFPPGRSFQDVGEQKGENDDTAPRD